MKKYLLVFVLASTLSAQSLIYVGNDNKLYKRTFNGDGTGAGYDNEYVISGGSSPIIVRRTADTSNSATTLVNLGSMRLDVVANKDYYFEFNIIFSSAALTTGIKFAVTCPASPTNIQTTAEIPIANNSASAMAHFFAQASGTALTGTAVGTINVNYIAKIYGILRNGNNAGSIQLQIASEVAASAITVKTGSWGTITLLN